MKEVIEFIRTDAQLLWDKPPLDVVNVLNGLLNVNTKTLEPHSPDFLSPIQLSVAYDPAARCPAVDRFVSEVIPEDSETIVWELAAWLITPDASIQKVALCLAPGGNGKSALLAMLVALVGKNNISALSLHELEGDRFAKAVLLGKLANVCPDLPSAHLSETSVFKAVTGGDELSAEYKYGDKFNFRPFAKLVFSANEPPRSDDSSHGFFRRWQVIPFSRTFQAGARGTIPRIQLDAMLADPTELSGVLNKALEALVVLRQRGDFTQSESMTAAWRDFKRATDPLSVFLDAYTVDDVDGFIIKEILIDLYSRQCFAAGRRMMTHKAFGAALKAARKDVELDKTRTIAGRVRGVYLGIRLVGETT